MESLVLRLRAAAVLLALAAMDVATQSTALANIAIGADRDRDDATFVLASSKSLPYAWPVEVAAAASELPPTANLVGGSRVRVDAANLGSTIFIQVNFITSTVCKSSASVCTVTYQLAIETVPNRAPTLATEPAELHGRDFRRSHHEGSCR